MFDETTSETSDISKTQEHVVSINNQTELLNTAIQLASDQLLDLQSEDGYWVFEFEADCTIPAEYIMMMHYIGDINNELQTKIATYLRHQQSNDGSYPLYKGGAGDISCSVKVYFALKLAGDIPSAEHMVRLRNFILSQGGAAKANVFTRIALATFEQIPWQGVPYIPVEIMLLPKWFPFHLDKVSYWSRTVMVPLFILCTYKATANNPHDIDILELFTTHPFEEKHYFPKRGLLNKCFLALDKIGLLTRPLIPAAMTKKATDKALKWFTARLNGEDGLGGIFPAMVNAYEAMLLLGIPASDERVVTARKAIDKLLIIKDHEAYCQPCLSPVWDTGLSALALQEISLTDYQKPLAKAYDWLKSVQLHHEPGDWRRDRPTLEGGGWAFQFANAYYPDIDDTAVIAFAMAQTEETDLDESLHRAARWVVGMQSTNGGFSAFEVDNEYYYLNEIPFADHGALLDPPTADVSARCIMFMGKLIKQGHTQYQPYMDSCINYIRNEQEADGSWFGRWGTNYIYGTWSVLMGIEQTNLPGNDPMYTQAVSWLKSIQREDGGWGEDNDSYFDNQKRGHYHISSAVHTAWALLGLMAAGEVNSPEVVAGINLLLRTQQSDGFWHDNIHNAPGFPRVFYLIYHGYPKFFPLWALAKYRNMRGNK